jgi:D-arabinose 1-dehydrogenase-like Zn-dependent alcohol dehydrogenase
MTNSVRQNSCLFQNNELNSQDICTNRGIQWSILPFPTQKGQVGGHEGVGKIVKLGPGAEVAGVKIGDRVGIKWIASACGNCRTSNLYFLLINL